MMLLKSKSKVLGLLSILVFSISFVPAFGIKDFDKVTVTDMRSETKFHSIVSDHMVNHPIEFSAVITNNQDTFQSAAYIIQIKDPSGRVESIRGIATSSLLLNDIFNASISWIPREVGNFTVDIFVWERLPYGKPLAESITLPIIVRGEHGVFCR